MKVKYLIAVQCILISFVLYVFKDLFIITLPIWLITLPVTVPLLVFILVTTYKKKKSKNKYIKPIKKEEAALLWMANYIHHDFTYLVHRNIFHLDKLTIEKIVELYDIYKDVGYAKHDKDPLLKEKLKGLKWFRNEPEILTNTIHFEIAQSDNYDNGRNSELYDSAEQAITMSKAERNKRDGNDDYWNKKTDIITKVTTVREIVSVIKPEDKKQKQ